MPLVGETIVSAHYNNHKGLPLAYRHTSPILQLRNFNNWLKAVLIAKFVARCRESFPNEVNRITVLDLACGKGGDVQKWAKHEVDHVVFADLAAKSIEECQSRYEDYKKKNYRRGYFKASFIVADCAKESLIERVASSATNVSLWPFEFHLTSCQFSLHYSFETSERADQMFRNAVEHLKPGGYFIGTIPNAYRIMKRLRESDKLEFGNSAYRIKFPDTFDKLAVPALFGCTYDFYLEGVVNCPEFLVYWPLFKHMAERHGMELKFVMNFDAFLKFYMADREALDLLDRMRGLESISAPPAPPGVDEMEHIVNYVNSRPPESRSSLWPIGTIGKNHWDVATIYLAFAFKKKQQTQ